MRPTRRGYAVALVVAGGVAAGAVFGARALDAVVLPAAVALVAAAVQLRRVSPPTLDRTVPSAETAGTERTITVALDGDRGVPATVRDRLPAAVDVVGPSKAGTSGREAAAAVTVGGRPVSYDVVPRRRGTHTVGPATVVVTDVLGLLKRSFAVDTRDTLLAYPRVGTLPAAVRAELGASHLSLDATQRDAFDDLREYVRGDSLRDVHWKSSARHDDLLVMEFTDRADPDRVTVAAGVADGAVADADDPTDWMADAAATVCVAVLRAGGSVALVTPSGEVEASPGRIRPALAHLAAAAGGGVPAPDADVVVVADADGVTVRFDGHDHRFDGPIGDAITVESMSDATGAHPRDGAIPPGADATSDEPATVDGGADVDRRAAVEPRGDGR